MRVESASPWSTASPSELAEALRTTLLLDDEPVGVRIVASTPFPVPSESPMPSPSLSASSLPASSLPAHRPAEPLFYCAAVRRAARGEAFRLTLHDIACDTAPRILGLEPGFRDNDFVESYVTAGLYRDRPTADAALADVCTLDATAHLIVAPLRHFLDGVLPDVVIVAATPYVAMRLVQASAFHGHLVRCEPLGMHGICSECTALAYATQQMTVSLLCSGTRHEAGWDDAHLGVGIPYALLGEIVDGLVTSIERFETDERKSAMQAACRCTASQAAPPALAGVLGHLHRGTGYFYRR